MAWVAVTEYYLRYNSKEKQAVVGIYYREGGREEGRLLTQHFAVSTGEALFLADLLRNEQPVYYDTETGALASGKEGVGESEQPAV